MSVINISVSFCPRLSHTVDFPVIIITYVQHNPLTWKDILKRFFFSPIAGSQSEALPLCFERDKELFPKPLPLAWTDTTVVPERKFPFCLMENPVKWAEQNQKSQQPLSDTREMKTSAILGFRVRIPTGFDQQQASAMRTYRDTSAVHTLRRTRLYTHKNTRATHTQRDTQATHMFTGTSALHTHTRTQVPHIHSQGHRCYTRLQGHKIDTHTYRNTRTIHTQGTQKLHTRI